MKVMVDHLGSKQFLSGNQVTLPDFHLFEMIEYAIELSDGGIFTTYPQLREYHARVKNLPGMKEYYEGPTMRKYPFVVDFAKIKVL